MTRIGMNCFFVGIYTFLYIMVAVATPLYADIYVYADKEGVLHFTNVPTSSTSSNYKVYIKETPETPLISSTPRGKIKEIGPEIQLYSSLYGLSDRRSGIVGLDFIKIVHGIIFICLSFFLFWDIFFLSF